MGVTEIAQSGAASAASDSPRSTFISGRDYLALPSDPTPWIIKDVIPIGGFVNMYGKPKVGKSFAALQAACAVADEETSDWLGFEIMKHGKVCYMQLDTPRSLWHDRLRNMSNDGWTVEEVYFADSLLVPEYPFNVMRPDLQNWLRGQIEALNPVLLVVDTIRESHEQDENDSTQMKLVIGALAKACVKTQTAIVLVSHARKGSVASGSSRGGESSDSGGADGEIMDDNRGSGYLAGKMDTVVKFTSKRMTIKGRATLQASIMIGQDEIGCVERKDSASRLSKCIEKAVKEWGKSKGDTALARIAATEAGLTDAEFNEQKDAIRKKVQRERDREGVYDGKSSIPAA